MLYISNNTYLQYFHTKEKISKQYCLTQFNYPYQSYLNLKFRPVRSATNRTLSTKAPNFLFFYTLAICICASVSTSTGHVTLFAVA